MTDILMQHALFTIKKLKKALQNQAGFHQQAIAIIGLSCRFPQSPNKEAFWRLLANGKNAISKLPEKRRSLLKGTYEGKKIYSDHAYWGGYLEDIEQFDSSFFGISPREAFLMDPQQRLLLEVTYEALEDAGINIERLAGSNTSVFVGMYPSEFSRLHKLENKLDALYIPTGNATSIAANRISYQFDLHGPSMTLDTACSTTLVAIDLACKYLQNNLTDLAIVGGVHINLLPSMNDILAQANMLSSDGQCKTFDADANGYVQGEGAGVIILKPLSNALRDHDRIYAVIAGTAVNQDGKTSGLTAPSGVQQEILLQTDYSAHKIDPKQVGYIECHGTGTVLGDPIELEALEHSVGKIHSKEQPCFIGSVKTNIGHLEPAAGIAGLIKVVLSLQKGKIPPHLNYTHPNPHIAFNKYHFQIPLQLQDWPVYGEYRIAGVSSFGFGGTNAHVIVRELTKEEMSKAKVPEIPATKEELFTISAKDPVALNLLIDKWHSFIKEHPAMDLSQLCHNTHLRRSHFPYRLAIIAYSIENLSESLSAYKKHPIENLPDNIFINNNHQENAKHMVVSAHVDTTKMTLKEIAQRYMDHQNIDWVKYEASRSYVYIDMPSYPWQHKSYWPDFSSLTSTPIQITNPLQGRKIPSPLDKHLQFEFNIDSTILSELKDTLNIMHIGFYLEMLAFAANNISPKDGLEICELNFLNMIYVPEKITINLILNKIKNKHYQFSFYTYNNKTSEWTEHANGRFDLLTLENPPIEFIDKIKKRLYLSGDKEAYLERMKLMRIPVSGSISWIEQFWRNDEEILCKFKEPKSIKEKSNLFMLKTHPGLFDACVQPLAILLDASNNRPYMTTKIKSFKYYGGNQEELFLLAKRQPAKNKKHLCGKWSLIDASGKVVATCKSIELSQLGRQTTEDKKLSAPVSLIQGTIKNPLLNTLQEKIAQVFKMPSKDLDINKPLQDFGMDSLMMIEISKQIAETTGVSFPMDDLLKPISIYMIADQLFENKKFAAPIETTIETAYIPYRQRRSNPKLRLLCFPYGGGGASVYREWSKYFPDEIEICPIQLPGRETLHSEALITEIDQLIPDLYNHLASEFTSPFAFYGHSFGALIAFELTRYLGKQNRSRPQRLFAAAYPAPQLTSKNLLLLMQNLKELPFNVWKEDPKNFTDEQLKTVYSIFRSYLLETELDSFSAELLRALLPRLLADATLVANYKYPKGESLNIPITAFYASDDTWIKKNSIIEWGNVTKNDFQMHKIVGGHLFIDREEGRKAVINAIMDILDLK